MKNTTLLMKIFNVFVFISFVTLGIVGAIMLGVNKTDPVIGLSLLIAGFATAAIHFVVMFFYNKFYSLKLADTLFENDFESKVISSEKSGIGIMLYDKNGKIIYMTEYLARGNFRNYLGRDVSTLVNVKKYSKKDVKVNEHSYGLEINKRRRIITITDIEEVKRLENIMHDRRYVVIVLRIDYSDRIKYDNESFESINGKVNSYLDEFAENINGTLLKSHAGDEVVIVSEWGSTKNWFDEKNRFFNKFDKLGENRKHVNISAGISSDNKTIKDLTSEARDLLRESLAKGGNVAVIVDAGEKLYRGTLIKGDSEKSQIEVSFFKEVLDAKARNAKNIIVTTHNFADADALASTIGIVAYLRSLNKDVKFFIESYDDTAKQAFQELVGDYKMYSLTPQMLEKSIKKNTLLIVTDTTDGDRIQISHKLLDKFQAENRLIIDHHRVSSEAIKTDIDSILLDTSASSASELVTMLLYQQLKGQEAKLKSMKVAQLLALGMFIDTNGLTKTISSNTFSSMAWLTKADADIEELTSFLSISKKAISSIALLYENVSIVKNKFIFSSFDKAHPISDDVVAQFANMLLNVKGIEASFVVAKTTTGKIKVSARSAGKISVQDIMVKIGGGGHFDQAAAAFNARTSIPKTVEKIKRIVRGL